MEELILLKGPEYPKQSTDFTQKLLELINKCS